MSPRIAVLPEWRDRSIREPAPSCLRCWGRTWPNVTWGGGGGHQGLRCGDQLSFVEDDDARWAACLPAAGSSVPCSQRPC